MRFAARRARSWPAAIGTLGASLGGEPHLFFSRPPEDSAFLNAKFALIFEFGLTRKTRRDRDATSFHFQFGRRTAMQAAQTPAMNVTARITPALRRKLLALADARGVSLSELMRAVLTAAVNEGKR
jgi:hypothetical protein